MTSTHDPAKAVRARIPVVDGDSGSVDEYGLATTREEAIALANEYFADLVVDAYETTNVLLSDGRVLPRAWVAVTGEHT